VTQFALQTVLITGGSSGLGLCAACQLAGKGANIVIVARNAERLNGAIEKVKVGRTTSRPCPLAMDAMLTQRESWPPAPKYNVSTLSLPT